MTGAAKKNFFVSYNKADRAWAAWIAWQLEALGYSVTIQDWDFRPGGNFVLDMQRAATDSERTIAVLSPDYLQALYTQAEWAAAFQQDPKGEQRLLIPVRVRECTPTGILAPITYVDLVGVSGKAEAVAALRRIVEPRGKPLTEPPLPGRESEPTYPGEGPAASQLKRSPARPESSPIDGVSERELIRQTLERVQAEDEQLALAIEYCAIPRRIEAAVIGALRESPGGADVDARLFTAISALPFVERKDGACWYRESARAVLLAEWNAPDRTERLAALTARLLAFYEAQQLEAKRTEQDLARVTEIIQHANPARRTQLSDIVDGALIRPLCEIVYHETLRVPEEGYQYFTSQYEYYESRGRLRICEPLIAAFEEAIDRAPAFPQKASQVVWLRYWKARLALSLGRYNEADEILRTVEQQAGDDVTLRLWVLGDRGRALQSQTRLREARDLYEQALALTRETGEDAFNRPVWNSRIADLLWTLDELEDAERKYRETIQSAEEAKNPGVKANALLSLSSLYRELGRWKDGLDAAFEALHLVRTKCQDDDLLEGSMRKAFMSLLGRRDLRLIETLFQEASAIADMGNPQNRLDLRQYYADLLREGGQLARAADVLTDLWPDAAAQSDGDVAISVLFSRAELACDQGNGSACLDLLKEIVERTEANGESAWQHAAALSRRAIAHLSSGALDRAEADALDARKVWEAIGHETQLALSHIMLAQIRRRQGRLPDAVDLLDTQRAVGSPLVRAQHHLVDGDVNRDLGRFRNALTCYRQSLDVNRSLDDGRKIGLALVAVANAAASYGEWRIAAESTAEAGGIWRQLSEADTYRPSPVTQQADADNAQGLRSLRAAARDLADPSHSSTDTLHAACDAFRSAISRVPDNVWYHLNLAYACDGLNDWEGAAAALDRLLVIVRERRLDWLTSPHLQRLLAEFRSRQSEALMAEGDRLMKADDASAAIARYQSALQMIPDTVADPRQRQGDLQTRIGLARFRLQDARAARAGFARAIKLYQESGDARPGDAIGTVCRSLLPGTRAYWALEDDWAAYLESERRDRELARHLSDARHALVGYLDEAYQLNPAAAERSYEQVTTPVGLELGAALIPADTRVDNWTLFTTLIPAMRTRISQQCGTEVPAVLVRGNDALPPTGYACLIDEVPLARGTLPEGVGFCPVDPRRLEELGINLDGVVRAPGPGGGEDGCWVPPDRWPVVVRCEIELWREPIEFAVRHLEAVLRRHLGDFLGVEETRLLLNSWRATEKGPSLIDAVLTDPQARFRFGRLLHALARQGVPLTDWKPILKVAQARQKSSLADLVQAVRPYLRERLPGNSPMAKRVHVPDDWERRLAAAFKEGVLLLSPSDAQQFTYDVRELLMPWDPNFVLVCRRKELRPIVQRLLEPEFPDLPVLAEEELVTAAAGIPAVQTSVIREGNQAHGD